MAYIHIRAFIGVVLLGLMVTGCVGNTSFLQQPSSMVEFEPVVMQESEIEPASHGNIYYDTADIYYY